MKLAKTLMITFTLLLGMEAMAAGFERIPVNQAAPETQMRALETFYGDIISVHSVTNVERPINLGKLMKSHQIELSSGEIFYPEELEYLINLGGAKSLERAPHTPD